MDGLGAKGLEDVEDVNGFADDWPKGEVDDDAKAELPKLIPPKFFMALFFVNWHGRNRL